MYVNRLESRPASYEDLKALELGGKPCVVKYSTLRNKVSILIKKEIIERYYNSKVSFFVIKGTKFGKQKVHDLQIKKLSKAIRSLPDNDRGLHDIHTKFLVRDIWKIVSYSGKYKIIQESSDIVLPPLVLNGMRIQASIHRTDTVTVTVACSNNPISTSIDDSNGVIRLASALSRFQERLQRILDECGESLAGGYENIPIPDINTWTITMWHFAVDSTSYKEEKICSTWKDGQGVLLREYTRQKQGKLRKERQEYPNTSLADAGKKLLNDNNPTATDAGTNLSMGRKGWTPRNE